MVKNAEHVEKTNAKKDNISAVMGIAMIAKTSQFQIQLEENVSLQLVQVTQLLLRKAPVKLVEEAKTLMLLRHNVSTFNADLERESLKKDQKPLVSHVQLKPEPRRKIQFVKPTHVTYLNDNTSVKMVSASHAQPTKS